MLRIAAFWLIASAAFSAPLELHISPSGDDGNAGTAEKPFATLDAAVGAVRKARSEGATVLVHDGTYALQKPVTITAQDVADSDLHLTIAAAPNAHPLFSGGRRVAGWKVRDGRWEVELADVKAGTWDFIDLFVSGERRPRPRLPKNGWFKSTAELPPPSGATGYAGLRFNASDLQATWANLNDVELLIPRP